MNLDDINFIANEDYYVAGIDEAGRGPLAGPVVASCVLFKRGEQIEGINDSKKLSEKKRNHLYDIIREKALAVGIGVVHEREIDRINILSATILAMKKAFENMNREADVLLIDGNNISIGHKNEKCIIKGDTKSLSIASASIIAKVTRDRFMYEYDKIFPDFSFKTHKGYGTLMHRELIVKFKPSIVHRMSFAPMKNKYDSSFLYSYIRRNPTVYIASLLIKNYHTIISIFLDDILKDTILSVAKNNILSFDIVLYNTKVSHIDIENIDEKLSLILQDFEQNSVFKELEIGVILISDKNGKIDINKKGNVKTIKI